MKDHRLHMHIIGIDGETWHVNGENVGIEGVELDVSPDGIHDEAPFKTLWGQSVYQDGATYLGYTVEPRDLVLGFNIMGDKGKPWEYVEERFFQAFHPDQESTIVVTTSSGRRSLKVRLLERTKTTSKHDPRIQGYSKMVLTLRAGEPFWVGDTIEDAVVFPTGEGTKTVTVANPTDVPLYPQWVCTAPGKWTIPDYSFTFDEHRERRITTPMLGESEHLTIDTYPLRERFTSATGSNVAARFYGVDFLNPVPPRTPPTEIPVTLVDGAPDSEIMVRLVEKWQRAYGRAY